LSLSLPLLLGVHRHLSAVLVDPECGDATRNGALLLGGIEPLTRGWSAISLLLHLVLLHLEQRRLLLLLLSALLRVLRRGGGARAKFVGLLEALLSAESTNWT
jgi:hypothetical protein